MGVEGIFPLLEEKGIDPEPVDTTKEHNIEVDLLGLFHSYILNTHQNIIYKDCRHAQSDPTRRLVHSLHSKLKSAFAFHPSNTIHIDGSPSLQKSRARQSRTAQKAKQEQALSSCYGELEVLAATTNNESQSSRTRRRLIKLIKQAREHWKKARVIDTTTREQIAKGLESLGWVVCRCKGEADICVRQKASENPETVVASTDSDYLFHGVKRLLRKDSRTHNFTSYDVDNIIQHLGVSKDQWALAAVVTNNDYSKQVRGQTFSKNIAAVRDCDKNDRSLALNQYCARFEVDATWFSQATDIFFDGIETLMEASASNDHIDTMFKEMVNSTTICLQQMKRQRSESPSTKHSYYVPKGSTKNQFRPTFNTKGSILAGKAYADITRAKKEFHNLPPRPSNQDPRPQKKGKKSKKKWKRKGRRKTTKSEKKVVLRPSTIVDHDLRKNHPVKSLTIGSASACLKKQGVAPDDANIMQKQLRLGVDLTSQLQQRAYFACALLIRHLLQDPSSPSSLLDRVIDNQTFIFGLARLLYFGRPKKAPAKQSALEDDQQGSKLPSPAETAQLAYKLFYDATQLPPLESVIKGIAIARLGEMAMVPVQASLRSHYRNATFEVEKEDKTKSDIKFFFEQNGSHRYTDFPKAKWAPRFVNISEIVLLDIFSAEQRTWNVVKDQLGKTGITIRTKEDAKAFVLDNKGSLVDTLFGHHGYRNVSLQGQTESTTKFKLKGTICTDGLVTHLLAYDTSVLRPKAACGEDGPDDNLETDHPEDLDTEIDDAFLDLEDDEDLEMKSLDEDLEMETPDDDGDLDDDIQGKPQIHDVVLDQMKTPSMHGGQMINWKQSSKLLQNVEVRFDDPANCPPHDDTIVIGLDPGEINTVTAARIDPKDPHARHIVTVRRTFLYRPTLNFSKLVQKRKDESGITELESKIPEFTLEGLSEYLAYLTRQQSAPDSSSQPTTVMETLLRFYNDPWYRKMKWESRKAATACMDYGIKGILRMADGSEGRKKNPEGRNVVFCIGLGSFNSRTGLTSKHSSFLKRFIIRAKSLGYEVVGCNEFYTSAKCPRPDCQEFLRNKGGRSRYCHNCGMCFDRDAIGAENIAQVCIGQLREQTRPAKYKPAPLPAQQSNSRSETGSESTVKRVLDATDDGPSPSRRRL